MRAITTLLEVLALALVITGTAMVFIPAAVILGGLGLAGLSYTLTRPTGGDDT